MTAGPYTGFFNWGGSGLSLGGMVRQFQWVQGGMVRQFQCPGGGGAPAPPLCVRPCMTGCDATIREL